MPLALGYARGLQKSGGAVWWKQGPLGPLHLDSNPNNLALDFVKGRYMKGGKGISLSDLGFASTHSSDILALNASGSYDTFGANEIVRNNLGLQVVPPSRINLAVQSNVLTDGSWYTGSNASVSGSGNSSPLQSSNWFTVTSAAVTGYTFVRQSLGSQTGDHSLSVICRKNNYRFIGLRPLGGVSTHAVFDFDTGTWVVVPTGYTVTSKQTALSQWELSVVNDAAGNTGNEYSGVCIPDATGSENPTLAGGGKS